MFSACTVATRQSCYSILYTFCFTLIGKQCILLSVIVLQRMYAVLRNKTIESLNKVQDFTIFIISTEIIIHLPLFLQFNLIISAWLDLEIPQAELSIYVNTKY